MEIMSVMMQVFEKCKEQYQRQQPGHELRILASLSETVVSKLLTLILFVTRRIRWRGTVEINGGGGEEKRLLVGTGAGG